MNETDPTTPAPPAELYDTTETYADPGTWGAPSLPPQGEQLTDEAGTGDRP